VILCITVIVQSGLQSPILDQRSTRSKNDNISLTTKPVQTRGFESSRPITEPQEVTATDATQDVYYNMSQFTNVKDMLTVEREAYNSVVVINIVLFSITK
jgi:hypothetical protein